MTTVLITGTNRGVGLALARLYAAQGADVIACCRNPSSAEALNELATSSDRRLHIMQLDVEDESSISSLKKAVGEQPIGILINNAGMSDPSARSPDKIDTELWMKTMRVNALGPMLIAYAFRDNLRRSSEKKLVAISSNFGSTSGAGGGSYAYRASKAALNNEMRGLSRDWADDGILVAILHPGWVRTAMGGGEAAAVSAEESAFGLSQRVAQLSASTSGLFQDYRGSPIRW